VNTVIFSYVPLLRGVPGILEAGEQTPLNRGNSDIMIRGVQAVLDSLPEGAASGCIWALEDGVPSAIFIFDRADEIRDHLVEWSEGDPGKWFDVEVAELADRYGISLMPDLRKSVDRHFAARALRDGAFTPDPDGISLVLRPLHFASTPGPTSYFDLRDAIGEEMKVGLLDSSEVGKPVQETDFSKVSWLGPFKVRRDGKSGFTVSVLQGRI